MRELIKKIYTYLKEERGAVAVEAGMYFVIFFLLCALLVDFSTVFLNKGHLERINNSLATILRERTAFYDANEILTQNDFDNLDALAATLLADSRIGHQYRLSIDAVHFNKNGNKADKSVAQTQTFSSHASQACAETSTALNIGALTPLSPWATTDNANGSSQRWLPVYQITLCVPGGESMFKRFLSLTGTMLGDIVIRNAVIPR